MQNEVKKPVQGYTASAKGKKKKQDIIQNETEFRVLRGLCIARGKGITFNKSIVMINKNYLHPFKLHLLLSWTQS